MEDGLTKGWDFHFLSYLYLSRCEPRPVLEIDRVTFLIFILVHSLGEFGDSFRAIHAKPPLHTTVIRHDDTNLKVLSLAPLRFTIACIAEQSEHHFSHLSGKSCSTLLSDGLISSSGRETEIKADTFDLIVQKFAEFGITDWHQIELNSFVLEARCSEQIT